MNKELLRKWLVEYKEEVIELVKDEAYDYAIEEYSVQRFYNRVRNNDIKNKEELYQLLLNGIIHRDFHIINYSFETYIEKFKYLFDLRVPVRDRINAAIYNSIYKLEELTPQEIINLVCFINPKKYYYYNQDTTHPFIDKLELDKNIYQKQKSNKVGHFFEAFNEVIKEEVIEEYCNFFYKKNTKELEEQNLYSKTSLVYEIKVFINKIIQAEGLTMVNNGYMSDVRIYSFCSIKERVHLNNLSNKKIIFLLGENGTGKTVLLKAILIALKKHFINYKISKEYSGYILQILYENSSMFTGINIYNSTNDLTYEFNEYNEFYLKNCYAYGTQRNKISKTEQAEPYGFLSLFQSNQYMTNVESWLLGIERKELKGHETIGIKGIERILGQILDYPNLKIVIKEEGMGEVFFELNNQEYKLHQLSEGYQTIMILVVDLLARLTLNNPDIRDTKDFRAVVLIDELDLFLHPKWEKNICGKLHGIFPNIQFFVTTHSPILVDGAVKDKRIDNTKIKIFKLGLENGATVVEREYTGDLIENWTPNLLINSEMFDDSYLEDLDDDQINELRTENNEAELLRTAKNFKIVSKREEELKQRYLKDLKKSAL